MATGWQIQCTRQVGEHLIAAELGRRNYAASPFAGNVPVFDILAADEGGYVVPVQVKAINGGDWQFTVSTYLIIDTDEKGQTVRGLKDLLNPNIVCVFVLLRPDDLDDVYIMLLSDLQILIHEHYKPREAPRNLKSFHFALRPKNISQFKERWDILDKAFLKVRGFGADDRQV